VDETRENLVKKKFDELGAHKTKWNIAKESLLEILKELARRENPLVLEIGTYNGYSALAMSMFAKRVWTIESDDAHFAMAKENCSVTDKIKLIHGDALKEMPKILQRFDVIFIDGRKSEYGRYLHNALAMLNSRGRIYVDNTLSHKDKLGDFYDKLSDLACTWRELRIGDGLIVVEGPI
jgi:predicted O-methyltransferase YrrM